MQFKRDLILMEKINLFPKWVLFCKYELVNRKCLCQPNSLYIFLKQCVSNKFYPKIKFFKRTSQTKPSINNLLLYIFSPVNHLNYYNIFLENLLFSTVFRFNIFYVQTRVYIIVLYA